jgi:hypothetical protein
MKTKALNKRKLPVFIIDKRLNEFDGQVLFPRKLAEVKEFIARAGLPWDKEKK